MTRPMQPRRTPPTAAPTTPPKPSLRARKKAATMHHVQQVALDLFASHDFETVSIEQVARTADVSPSTIYRYFGTKEGLILHDEYDDRLLDVLRYCLDQDDDVWSAARTSLATIWEDHFVTDEASTRLRTRLWFEIPRVQAAGYLVIADQVDQFARIMADTGRWSFPQARIISSGIVWSFVAALRNWYDSGLDTDWRDHITDLITWLERSCTPQTTSADA